MDGRVLVDSPAISGTFIAFFGPMESVAAFPVINAA